MKTIRELFARPLDRRIEEVIKVDQAEEATVRQELIDYVVTDAIKSQFVTIYKAIADAKSEPHEGIGVWISGFFGSGKSYFAKILGYTVAARKVADTSASEVFKQNAKDEQISNYLDVINTQIPTHSIIFDVSMDRGVRTANERLTEIMYKALLRELDYSEDSDLAELEITLEGDSLLEEFEKKFEALHNKPWKTRRKLGMAVNEASAVLNLMNPEVYPSPDSWAKSLGEGRADITPNLLADRAFELVARRKPNHTVFFVIDEVGQYVSRSVEKMLDLQAVVQAFGREGKNRVLKGQAVAPCWIVVTSQEKLNEVVDALDSKKIELARLQDRFPYPIDLKQSDIAEITGKRVLEKTKQAGELLGQLYDQHEGRLKTFCSLEKTSRNTQLTRAEFIDLYPYLPYQIDLSIDIVSGLRLRRGAQRHIGGSNRTLIKQAEQMLKHPQTNYAAAPVGNLVTLDKIYELLYAGNLLPTETTRQIDEVPSRIPDNDMAYRVVKAIALLEVVTDLPRTVKNLTAVLHPDVDAESQENEVQDALKVLEQAQIIRESEDGYKLLSAEEKDWETTRRSLEPKPADRNKIVRDVVQEILSDPSIRVYRYQDMKAFRFSLIVNGTPVLTDGQIPLNVWFAEDSQDLDEKSKELRKESDQKREELFWLAALTEGIHQLIEELHRSQEMVSSHERDAAQGKLRGELSSLFAEEKVRRDRIRRDLREKLRDALQQGHGFFQAVQHDGSSLGRTLSQILHALLNTAIPLLYPKLELGNKRLKGDEIEKFMTAANLAGLAQIFHGGENGLDLVIKQENKHVPNLGAEISREILDYLRQEHSYGNRVTGKILEKHFEGIGYGWDRDVLRLVLAVLLRGGAIEVTHQGRKYRHHNDPAARGAFTHINAFRAASFAPREALGLKTLAGAARAFEQITGKEVDVEESAIAQVFHQLAREDREQILPLLASMRAYQLPGAETIAEHLETIEGILEMPPDDCVKTLAGEGQNYEKARRKVLRLCEVLNTDNLELIEKARLVITNEWPILEANDINGELKNRAQELRQALETEHFYGHLEAIRLSSRKLHEAYTTLYKSWHEKRFDAFSKAVDDIKGLPEWATISEDDRYTEDQRNAILAALRSRACTEEIEISAQGACCRCRASIGQIESDLNAVDGLKSQAVQRLFQMLIPEQKVDRVKASEVITGVMQNQEDVDAAIEKLRAHLYKLVAEGVQVVLE